MNPPTIAPMPPPIIVQALVSTIRLIVAVLLEAKASGRPSRYMQIELIEWLVM